MAFELPRFFVLQAFDEKNYLGYNRDGGEFDQGLHFMETEVISPFAKFEVEKSSRDPQLVHIRSCQNNRYWVVSNMWGLVSASAKEPEEDQSKSSCTLFKPIAYYPAANMIRIMHMGEFQLYLRVSYQQGLRAALMAMSTVPHKIYDIFTVIDWESLVILPRYVAFKGANDLYLRPVDMWPENRAFVQLSGEDIGDPSVACEVYYTPGPRGIVRIKNISSGRFWVRTTGRHFHTWIAALSSDTTDGDRETLFRPVKVDSSTIGLLNVGINQFCRLQSDPHNEINNVIHASIASIVRDALFIVEEAVLTREIYNVRYHVDDARIYDERLLRVDTNSATNGGSETSVMDVKLGFSNTRTSTWNAHVNVMLGRSFTYQFGIPLIAQNTIQVYQQIQGGVEWGKTTTSTTAVEVVNQVNVPPRTRVTVTMTATNGRCDIPFSYTQRDTLYNGNVVITQVHGGVYTGANYYNISFESREEKI